MPTQFGRAEAGWVILSSAEARLKAKIEEAGTPLKDWDVSIYRGILTGFNEAFIIDGATREKIINQSPESAEIIRPLLRGQDIKKYKANFQDKWLINTHNGIKNEAVSAVDAKNYPPLYAHLKKYESELTQRLDKGSHWTNLRNCAYVREFEKPKIVWQELSRSGNAFSYVEETMYLNNTGYILTGESPLILKYLTAILNHNISLFYLEQVYNKLDDTGWRWFKVAVEKIPIPIVSNEIIVLTSELVDAIQIKTSIMSDYEDEMSKLNKIIYALFGFSNYEIDTLEKRIDSHFKY